MIFKFQIVCMLTTAIFFHGCSSKTTVVNKHGRKIEIQCQPVYGNWCGKGYPAYEVTGYKPDPVDVWDAACMNHDLCYDKYGDSGKDWCDQKFARNLESIDMKGIPAPHQIVNAYNYFKENKPYRNFRVTFNDLGNASSLSCRGGDGRASVFCDVGRGRNNCETTMGLQEEGKPCFCDYPPIYLPTGFIPGGRFFGYQKTANDF